MINDGGSSIISKGVCWSTNPIPTINDYHTDDGTGVGQFVSNMSGLTDGTFYYLRAYAINSAGIAYGNKVTFVTNFSPVSCGNSITYEGKNYNTVQIGDQCWLKENLNVGIRIDDSIDQTNNSTIEKYCYNNLESNCDVYGGHYQWNEAMQYTITEGAKGICPSGWHVPTDYQWRRAIDFLGGENVAGGKMKETGTSHWCFPNTGATNSSNFTALAAGEHSPYTNNWQALCVYTSFWTSYEWNNTNAYAHVLRSFTEDVWFSNPLKSYGLSVRCIKDSCTSFYDVGVSIVASANPVNPGTSVIFTATPINGGSTPSYQWKVNGTNVGSDNPVYSYVPTNNDMITCVLTSSEKGCIKGNPATSNSITMVVNPSGFDITGAFLYNNTASTAMASLWVILNQNGTKVDSALTNNNGRYIFVGKPGATYTMGANCSMPWGGINATDAVIVEYYFIGLASLTVPVRLLAADVNNSNTINATDAVKIKRRFVGLDNSFARGDWTFAKPTGGDTVIITGTSVVQDFQGLCVGDVNGSHIPAPGDVALSSVLLLAEGVIDVMQGNEFELPFKIRRNEQISAISLVLGYPSENLELISISISQGDVLYMAQNGQIRIAWSQVEPLGLSTGDVLLTLKFRLSESAPLGIPIKLNIENESELADGWGKPISNSLISAPSVLPVTLTAVRETGDLITKVTLYPNPSSNNAWLEFDLTLDANVVVEWYNMVGERINTIRFDGLSKGWHKKELDVSGFSNGVYTLKTTIKGRSTATVYNKLVKSK